MSPGKCISPPPAVIIAGRHSPIISAQKSLTFGTVSLTQKVGSPNAGLSWADKVKGCKPSPNNSPSSQQISGMSDCVNQETSQSKASYSTSGHNLSDSIKKGEATSESSNQVAGNDVCDDDDDDGWEIVARGKHRSRGSSTSVSLKTSVSQDSVEALHLKIDQNNEQKSLSFLSPDTMISTVGSAFERIDKSSSKASGIDTLRHSSVENVPDTIHKRASVEKSNFTNSHAAQVDEDGGAKLRDKGLKKEENVVPKIDLSGLSIEQKELELTEEKDLSLDSPDAESYGELILEADIDGLIQNEAQQEEDMISRQIEEENEKALASAIEEEEHLTKELEDEALKNMDDELTEDVSSDREANNTYESQDTPREMSELDESVSILHQSTQREIGILLFSYEAVFISLGGIKRHLYCGYRTQAVYI